MGKKHQVQFFFSIHRITLRCHYLTQFTGNMEMLRIYFKVLNCRKTDTFQAPNFFSLKLEFYIPGTQGKLGGLHHIKYKVPLHLPLARCMNIVASCWKVLGRSLPRPRPAKGFLGSGAFRIFIKGLKMGKAYTKDIMYQTYISECCFNYLKYFFWY